MFSSNLIALFSAGLAAVASAYTTPVGDPSGNPIYTPGISSTVPVGKPYEITWDPTTTGTVTLVLLRGPSTNIKPLYPIVEELPNTGSYSWTPSADLEPDVTHYGIQLIVDATGQYQYTTQFGISNPNYGASSSSAAAVSSTAAVYSSAPVASTPAIYSSAVVSNVYPSETPSNETVVSTPAYTPSGYTPSGYTPSGYTPSGPVYVSTIVRPTNPMTVPHTLTTYAKPTGGYATGTNAVVYPSQNATATVPVVSQVPTGAAGRVAVSFGVVMGAFALVL